ncbi:hypothetical protein [Streptomyces antarcticus]|uniref:hypothetical protein n=1 Tax=Streptomyces antarcticus TaxID=2996458 RepID=UPI00226EF20A|nr:MULTISPECIES: hypothetical protein [unclassified Streptomyces]MCY0943269.1 hypothetical protein [Streptomyces sp. H34-AA3]MCZ4082541.1 hypothetical protein [Streptomyces sp. H34-S5]
MRKGAPLGLAVGQTEIGKTHPLSERHGRALVGRNKRDDVQHGEIDGQQLGVEVYATAVVEADAAVRLTAGCLLPPDSYTSTSAPRPRRRGARPALPNRPGKPSPPTQPPTAPHTDQMRGRARTRCCGATTSMPSWRRPIWETDGPCRGC